MNAYIKRIEYNQATLEYKQKKDHNNSGERKAATLWARNKQQTRNDIQNKFVQNHHAMHHIPTTKFNKAAGLIK